MPENRAAVFGLNTRPNAKPDESTGALQAVIANANAALNIAANLAPLIPVPFLSSLFVSAKVIVDAAIQVRQSKLGCAELAQRVAEIARDVRKEVMGKEDLVEDSLKMALEQLDRNFTEISDFMQKEAKRGHFSRIVHREGIAGRLGELTTMLNDSMCTFQSTSTIRLELKLEKVSKTVSSMDGRLALIDRRAQGERRWDGQYRIYRIGELQMGPRISSERRLLHRSLGMMDEEVVEEELVTATVKNRVVAVKSFRGPADIFEGTLSALKKVRHMNVAQLEGYSDDDDLHFVVFKGQLLRFEDYMTTVTPKDRYNLYLRGVMSTLSGHYHLCLQGLTWLGRLDDLMVDQSSGTVILGAQDDFVQQKVSISTVGGELANSPPAVQFMKLLPSLIRDWDLLRDMAAYFPSSYQPALYEPDRDSSATSVQQLSGSQQPQSFNLFATDDGAGQTLEERVILVVHEVLMSRIKGDGYWFCLERNAARRTSVVGNIVEFENFSYDENAQDYKVLGAVPKCDFDMECEREQDENLSVGVMSMESGMTYQSNVYMSIPCETAWSLLVKHGPEVARERGVRLRRLGIMSTENLIAEMRFEGIVGADRPLLSVADSEGKEVPSMNFHFRFDDNGLFEEPLGYFLLEEMPLPEGSPLPMVQVEDEWANFIQGESTNDEEESNCEEIGDDDELPGIEYKSTLEGIQAMTKQRLNGWFVRLHPDQADMLDWAHSLLFSPMRIEYRHRSLYP